MTAAGPTKAEEWGRTPGRYPAPSGSSRRAGSARACVAALSRATGTQRSKSTPARSAV
ncbi:hypothetical protein [Streptomyces virginiae]|uniref:hypothetical protein n=1 Tax=Streptomyces virginiae TaxID=1961 RepID=UPI00224E8772|nr:hypothetical protein [Streptomyces virginiae]MCX4957477.1 hypothetical protein [Streptomyces virginiae]